VLVAIPNTPTIRSSGVLTVTDGATIDFELPLAVPPEASTGWVEATPL
jgi:hypothetical protein